MLARQARIFYEKLEEILNDLDELVDSYGDYIDELADYEKDEFEAYTELRKNQKSLSQIIINFDIILLERDKNGKNYIIY